jgi:hypothetical protein
MTESIAPDIPTTSNPGLVAAIWGVVLGFIAVPKKKRGVPVEVGQGDYGISNVLDSQS